ncbi:hypothetical protein BT63DRAFT_454200 [Microthyrium microscopicum]|uniref:SRR1-like domain-containing protein n=1 Tax=Microthyrium microscopicum TaxID=703497 RepID=A0A6A6UEU9_9PEZI|nr:hypothetical protein BT63DRAFT_454200 [Microthyrium microscopicum]
MASGDDSDSGERVTKKKQEKHASENQSHTTDDDSSSVFCDTADENSDKQASEEAEKKVEVAFDKQAIKIETEEATQNKTSNSHCYGSDEEGLDDLCKGKLQEIRKRYSEINPLFPTDQLFVSWNGEIEEFDVNDWPDDLRKDCVPRFIYTPIEVIEIYVKHGIFEYPPLQIGRQEIRDIATPFEDKVTVKEIIAEFENQADIWRSGEIAAAVKEELSNMQYVPTEVVGLALGSMVFSYGSAQNSSDTRGFRFEDISQYAAIWVTGKILQDLGTKNVDIYAQDPNLTEKDQTVLKHFGITTLEDPWAFLTIDDHTVVLNVNSNNIPSQQIVADDPKFWPAAYTGDHTYISPEEEDPWIEKVRVHYHSPDATGQRFRDMMKTSYRHRRTLPYAPGFPYYFVQQGEKEVVHAMDMITRKAPAKGSEFTKDNKKFDSSEPSSKKRTRAEYKGIKPAFKRPKRKVKDA